MREIPLSEKSFDRPGPTLPSSIGKAENQFSLTSVSLSTTRPVKSNFLSNSAIVGSLLRKSPRLGEHLDWSLKRSKARTLILLTVASLMLNAAAQPIITHQPGNQTVLLYDQAAFGVIVSDETTVSYQWRKDGVPIGGATNDQLVLPQVRFSDAGAYSVVVSVSEKRIASADASLTVNPPKPGDLDCSFACSGSINGAVRCLSIQPDGKVLIAGDFSVVSGAPRGGIARLNRDGTTDHTFMNGLSGVEGSEFSPVRSIAVQGDRKLLIAGNFTRVNGSSRNNVVRLNADGSLDEGFQTGIALSNPWGAIYYPLVIQTDGKVLVAGYFEAEKADEPTHSPIARFNPDGSPDSDFRPPAVRRVLSIALQGSGKIIVGYIGNDGAQGVLQLNSNGSLDTGFQCQTDGGVDSIVLQDDGKVLIGGKFGNVNTITRGGIARLNPDGTLDSSFQKRGGAENIDPELYPSVIALQSDGKILIGGGFTMGNDEIRGQIARLNPDGTLDFGFSIGISGPAGYPVGVSSIAVQSDGRVLIGGNFTAVNGESRAYIARLNSDGTLDGGFQNGGQGPGGNATFVTSIAQQNDGKVFIAGDFTTIDNAVRTNFARLNPDGTLDVGFHHELPYGLWGSPIAVQTEGKVFVQNFRLDTDGSFDSAFNLKVEGFISSYALQSDGKVLVGGFFAKVNGVERNSIARLNSDGSLDETFQTGDSCPNVRSIALQNDGRILVGGGERVAGSQTAYVARLNTSGALDDSFHTEVSGACCDGIFAVTIQNDGKILIGGDFTTVNGTGRDGIARLSTDGSLDSRFQTGFIHGIVTSIALQPDEKIFVGGFFIGSRNRVARLNTDGTLDNSFQEGLSGANGAILSLLLQRDGKLLIAGDFMTVNGHPAAYIARLWGNAEIPPEIKSLDQAGSKLTLSWFAIPNRTYRVQYNSNLPMTAWTDLPGETSAAASIASKTYPSPNLPGPGPHFFRVVLLP